jgi:hypothetical protein
MTILLSLLSLLLVQQPASTEFGTITGQLRDAKGVPVVELRVFAMPVDPDAGIGTLVSITESDSQGRYRLEDVPPGRYWVAAGLVNSPTYYPGVADRSKGQVLTIAAGQAITNLDFAFAFPSAPPELRGRVEVDDGSALPGRVWLILTSDSAYWISQPSGGSMNQQVFFQSVMPGKYFLRAAPLPLDLYLKSMTFGSVDLTTAPLTFTEGSNKTEIKVVLTRKRPAGLPPGVRVSGHVITAAGIRPPLVLAAITPVSGAPSGTVSNPVARITPRADRVFEFEGVLPGRYELRSPNARGFVTLDVAGNDITNLDLSITPAGFSVIPPTSLQSLTGIVEVGNGTIPKFELGFSTMQAGQAATHTAVVSGKEFAVSLPPGEYRVNVLGLPNGYTVESVRAGPLDLTYAFLLTNQGIADRFTGIPIPARSAGQPTITVRLKAP